MEFIEYRGAMSWPLLADISDLNLVWRRISQTQLAGDWNIIGHVPDWWQARARAPLLKSLQRNGVERHGILARIKRGVVQGPVGLRLRTAGVLRDEAIH